MFDIQRLICQRYLTCQDLINLKKSKNKYFSIREEEKKSIWNLKKYIKLQNQQEENFDYWFSRFLKLKILNILSIVNFYDICESLVYFGQNETLEKIVITLLINLSTSLPSSSKSVFNIYNFKVLKHFEISCSLYDTCSEDILNFLCLNYNNDYDEEIALETLILHSKYINNFNKRLYLNEKFKNLKTLKILKFHYVFIDPSVLNNLETLSIDIRDENYAENLQNLKLHCKKLKNLTLNLYVDYFSQKYKINFLEFLKTLVANNKETLKYLSLIDNFAINYGAYKYQCNANMCNFFNFLTTSTMPITIDLRMSCHYTNLETLYLFKNYITILDLKMDNWYDFSAFSNLQELNISSWLYKDSIEFITKAINNVKKTLKKLYIANIKIFDDNDDGDDDDDDDGEKIINTLDYYLEKDNVIEFVQFDVPVYNFEKMSKVFPNLKSYCQIYNTKSNFFDFSRLVPAIQANKNVQLENCKKFKVAGNCWKKPLLKSNFCIEFFVKHV